VAFEQVTAVILAGGQARRMGRRDKGLVTWQGRPLIEHTLSRINPQVGQVVINANRNLEQYQHYGFPVIADRWPDYQGPLAGIASVYPHLHTEFLLCVPCDSPCLPSDLVHRLMEELLRQQAEISTVICEQKIQAACFLAHKNALQDLDSYLAQGKRKVQDWLRSKRLAEVDFSDRAECFINLNTPNELNATYPGS